TLMPALAWAQNAVLQGRIVEAANKNPMVGAIVYLPEANLRTQTNNDGEFRFNRLKNDRYKIVISYIGFKPLERIVSVNGQTSVDFSLEKSLLLADEVVVSATRASANSATTFKNISKEDIGKNNFSQDLPFLINQTPSVVVSSDAGAGVGY